MASRSFQRRNSSGSVRGAGSRAGQERLPGVAWALILVLALMPEVGGTARAATADATAPGGAEDTWSATPDAAPAARPLHHGLYLGFGFVREYLRLSLDDRSVLPSTGIEMDEWGAGAAFTLGYQWSPRFRGELALGGTGHPATPDDATAGSAFARFTGYVPLLTGGTWEPHLIGGLSGWAAIFKPQGGKELAYLGVTGDAGFGLRVHFGRHWSAQADYLHAAIDVDQEITDREGEDPDMLQLGHRGRAELIRLGVLYDF